jgi:AcrR family transcriptional regulator
LTPTPTGRLTSRRLDRDTVVAAARDLLDAQGLSALTMARLGEQLGVTAMALYRHVADRSDLELAVVELVLADLVVDTAPNEDWASGIAGWMAEVREHWLRHPWIGPLLGTRTKLAPPWVVVLDRLAVILTHAGFPPDVVARELVRISRVTTGIVILEIAAPLPHPPSLEVTTIEGLTPAQRQRWTPLVEELARYSNEGLFDDIVRETIERLRLYRSLRS